MTSAHVVKKAYYGLSLEIHPDRVAENEKEESTEKFKILTKIHGILVDTEKKKLYDQQGIIDDDINVESKWGEFFGPADIENCPQNYIGKFFLIEL